MISCYILHNNEVAFRFSRAYFKIKILVNPTRIPEEGRTLQNRQI